MFPSNSYTELTLILMNLICYFFHLVISINKYINYFLFIIPLYGWKV